MIRSPSAMRTRSSIARARALALAARRSALVVHGHFDQLLADGHRGIQRGHRLLVDHGDGGTANPAQLLAAHGQDVASLKQDLAADDAAGFGRDGA